MFQYQPASAKTDPTPALLRAQNDQPVSKKGVLISIGKNFSQAACCVFATLKPSLTGVCCRKTTGIGGRGSSRVAQGLALDVRRRFAWDISPELTDVFTKLDPLFYKP